MPRLDLSYYGNYNNPQVLNLTNGMTPVILAQDFFDFTTIANANINLFLGLELKQSVAGGFFPIFGIFIAVDGDLVAANLFTGILPALQVSGVAVGGAFKGTDNNATIANPNSQMQIALAYTAGASGGGAPATYLMRSGLLDGMG